MITHPGGKMSTKHPVLLGMARVKGKEQQDKAWLTFTIFQRAKLTAV